MLRKLFSLIIVFLFLFGCATSRPSQQPAPVSRDEIRAVLKAHPEMILDVLNENSVEVYKIAKKGARHNAEQEQETQWWAELDHPRVPEIDPHRPFLGSPDAPVVIVCYSDFQCRFCHQAYQTMKDLLELYPKKIRFVFKHFPSSDVSRKAAMYFEAIGELDPARAWEFHDRLFDMGEGTPVENESMLQALSASLSLNTGILSRRLKTSRIADKIEKDINEANDFGIDATPTFLINGAAIHGAAPLEAFERLIRLIENRKAAGKG